MLLVDLFAAINYTPVTLAGARGETALFLFNADAFNCRFYSLLLLVHFGGGVDADVREPGGEVKK